jgi:hypothetical protein
MRMYAKIRNRAGAISVAVALALVVSVPTVAVPTLQAQQAPTLEEAMYNLFDSMGMLRSLREVDMLMSLQVWGTGTIAEVTETTVGPAVPMESYYAEYSYEFPAMRLDVTLASGERRIEVVSGDRGLHAWNEIGERGGGLVEGYGSAEPAMDALSMRLLRMWLSPAGVAKAAAAAGAQVDIGMELGAVVLTFPLTDGEAENAAFVQVGDLAGTSVKLTLDNDSRPARAELEHGGRQIVVTYSDYGDLNWDDYQADVILPRHVVATIDGQTAVDLTVENTNTYNPYVLMPVPDSVLNAAQ